MTGSDLTRLEGEARYHRERLGLYRARAYGSDTTTPGRLRELERASAQANRRLASLRGKTTGE